jgi:hypothetical protein
LGNITLLNDQGFFLTPHHCIEDYLNEPDTKRRWLIVFDPINETVYTSDILIHSERYDIAIGKLKTNKYNIFNKISNKNISLAKEQPKRGNLVFCLKYRDIDSVLKLIYNDVFNEGLLNWSEIDNGYMIDRFDGIDDFKINRLKPVTPVGFYEDDCSSPEGPLRSNWRCSRFIDIIRKGHSGSPIYNNRSQLLGIISYMTQLTPAINDCEGIRFDMAFFAGPKVISKMISFYNQKVK